MDRTRSWSGTSRAAAPGTRPRARSVAAPARAQDAHWPPATNGTAPVTPRQGAAIERTQAHELSGAAASGAGIAGMAGPAGPARPEEVAGAVFSDLTKRPR